MSSDCFERRDAFRVFHWQRQTGSRDRSRCSARVVQHCIMRCFWVMCRSQACYLTCWGRLHWWKTKEGTHLRAILQTLCQSLCSATAAAAAAARVAPEEAAAMAAGKAVAAAAATAVCLHCQRLIFGSAAERYSSCGRRRGATSIQQAGWASRRCNWRYRCTGTEAAPTCSADPAGTGRRG